MIFLIEQKIKEENILQHLNSFFGGRDNNQRVEMESGEDFEKNTNFARTLNINVGDQ